MSAPIRKPAQFEKPGFCLAIYYGISLLLRISRTRRDALAEMASA